MPRLPDKRSLSTSIPRAVRPVPHSGDMSYGARAMADVGKVISAIGEEEQKKEDALDLIRADVAHKTALIDTERNFDNDPDYKTYDQRFGATSSKITFDAASLIRNPRMREQWALKAQLENQRVRDKILTQGAALDRQQKFADVQDVLQKYQDIYADSRSTPEQKKEALANIDTSIALAERSGLIHPLQARKLHQEIRMGAIMRDFDAQKALGNTDQILRDIDQSLGPARPVSKEETNISPETRARPIFKQGYIPGVASISARLETGKDNPLEGVKNISKDAKGSRSYGNFGINSLGSAQQFKREYGAELGLTATPGTDAFDKQWLAADPQALHEAEIKWYNEHIGKGVSDKLQNVGVDSQIANDPRVQAYFADRLVQYGPNLNKYATRVASAFKASDGDPVKFLKEMSAADRAALQTDFRSAIKSGVYGPKGHETRISGREALALNASGLQLGERTGRYAELPVDALLKMRKEILKHRDESLAGEREQLKQANFSAEDMLKRTGNIPADYVDKLARAERILQPNQIATHITQMMRSKLSYDAQNDLPTLTSEQLDRRLVDTDPSRSPDKIPLGDTTQDAILGAIFQKIGSEAGFHIRRQVYDETERRINKIRELRLHDPATAVDEHPDVAMALSAYRENPDDPEAIQNLIRARIDAQEKIGIPYGRISPITKIEAMREMSPVIGLPEAELVPAMEKLYGDMVQKYGEYAPVVATSAIYFTIKNRDQAELISGAISDAWNGVPIRASQIRKLELANEAAMAERAFSPESYPGEPFRQFGIPTAETQFPRGVSIPRPGTPIVVQSVEEARKLPPGTVFQNPEGKIFTR